MQQSPIRSRSRMWMLRPPYTSGRNHRAGRWAAGAWVRPGPATSVASPPIPGITGSFLSRLMLGRVNRLVIQSLRPLKANRRLYTTNEVGLRRCRAHRASSPDTPPPARHPAPLAGSQNRPGHLGQVARVIAQRTGTLTRVRILRESRL